MKDLQQAVSTAFSNIVAAGTRLIIDGDENSINTYYPGRDY